ncbi:hypothetical protein AALP_AA5G116000 [Arabis alpina]|uniref:Uncharacterized protein n=1 Tax=Arabis alpina TaxID=50452 RepID=A0A087GWG5_ARAAL|nr:hypothetical protein AALP_AA5G116000 [Arabis alpina]
MLYHAASDETPLSSVRLFLVKPQLASPSSRSRSTALVGSRSTSSPTVISSAPDLCCHGEGVTAPSIHRLVPVPASFRPSSPSSWSRLLGQNAEKTCSDAASSSWLRPYSKPTDETHALDTRTAGGPRSPPLVDEPVNDFPIRVEELADDAPVLVDVKAEIEEFDNAVEQRKLNRQANSRRRAPRRSRKKPRPKKFKTPDPPGSTISDERSLGVLRLSNLILEIPENAQATHTLLASRGCNWEKHFSLRRVEKARAFFGGSSVSSFCFSDQSEEVHSEMGKRSFGDLASGSAGVAKAHAPPSTSSVPRTTSTRCNFPDIAPNTATVPNTAPGPNTAPAAKKSACTPLSIFLGVPASDPKAARSSVPLFLAFVNRVGHMLEAEIEKHKLRADAYAKGELVAKTERNKYADQLEKRDKMLEKALGDNQRLRVENDKLTETLEAAEKDASNSLSFLASLNAQVAELKTKREANLDFVKQLLGLIPERKVPKLEDELASLTADVEAHAGDEEYFDKLMETFGECSSQDVPLEKLAADAGVMDVSGSHMFSESAGGLLQEIRIDSAGLLKDLMISEEGRMSFAGEDKVEETTIAAEDIRAEETKTVRIEKTAADVDGAEKAASKKAGEDEEAHS